MAAWQQQLYTDDAARAAAADSNDHDHDVGSFPDLLSSSSSSSSSSAAAAARLSDGEHDPDEVPLHGGSLQDKTFDLVTRLRAEPHHGALSYRDLRTQLGLDLWRDADLVEHLARHPQVELDPDLRRVAFAASLGVSGPDRLAGALQRAKRGVLLGDLKEESYAGVERDVADLVHDGRVMAVNGTEILKTLMFPRYDKQVFTELPGTVSVSRGGRFLRTTHDLRDEIRRGDVILVGALGLDKRTVFRVSSASTGQLAASWVPSLSAASSGVPNTATIPPRVFPFTETVLPLGAPFQGASATGAKCYRFGFPNFTRRVWASLAEADGKHNPCVAPNRDQDGTLTGAIAKCEELGLMSEAGLQVARSATGASKARRKRGQKRQSLAKRVGASGLGRRQRKKITQTHLVGIPGYEGLLKALQGGD